MKAAGCILRTKGPERRETSSRIWDSVGFRDCVHPALFASWSEPIIVTSFREDEMNDDMTEYEKALDELHHTPSKPPLASWSVDRDIPFQCACPRSSTLEVEGARTVTSRLHSNV